MTPSAPQSSPQILLTSAGRAWTGMHAKLLHVPRGLTRAPGGDMHRLGMHFGPPVNADCSCDGMRMRRVQKSGDIDVVPAGLEGSWEDDADCSILQLSLDPSLLRKVAQELGRDPDKTRLRPRFQVRDTRIEAIGWAIKADLEADMPSDPLYIDLLANALAVRLIETASDAASRLDVGTDSKFSARQLRTLIDFIESHLELKLHLADIAAAAGVSGTRLKTLFRNSTGVPVHQYIIRRRVDRACTLLATSAMPASEIAIATGFSHQSHMSATMRRVLGRTPGDFARSAKDFRPILQKPV